MKFTGHVQHFSHIAHGHERSWRLDDGLLLGGPSSRRHQQHSGLAQTLPLAGARLMAAVARGAPVVVHVATLGAPPRLLLWRVGSGRFGSRRFRSGRIESGGKNDDAAPRRHLHARTRSHAHVAQHHPRAHDECQLANAANAPLSVPQKGGAAHPHRTRQVAVVAVGAGRH